MIRLFKVYYPLRTLLLLAGEAVLICGSFVAGVKVNQMWTQAPSLQFDNQLLIEGGLIKIIVVTAAVLLVSHWFDLYDVSSMGDIRGDLMVHLLSVLGLTAFTMAGVDHFFPDFLPGNVTLLAGLLILTVTLLIWRAGYAWMLKLPYLRERVYVLGTGERAQRLVNGLRQRSQLGIEVVGWSGDVKADLTRDAIACHLLDVAKDRGVHRVIVAMPDRRGTLPVEELLDLRIAGVRVEEATSWLEKISGKIEVEQLYPSWLIFAEGFRFSLVFRLVRRLSNFLLALIGLLLALPLIPLIMLAVKLSSRGPAFYHQKRVGRQGKTFFCHKFRTMRQDAEADTGATWATDDDPRITKVGKFLRTSRLDEIPQLLCVLKGDMHFVGPRPERPEFVERLSKEIRYYGVRHMVRPGVTGWAQVQYKYGNTVDDAREKLQYDLFYIKNASIGLDLLILFQTVKIVLLGRGAR